MVDMDKLATLKLVALILAMVHRINMVDQHHTVCIHKLHIASLMDSLGLFNLEKCLTRPLQLKHMVQMYQHSKHTHMHLVVQSSKVIPHMALHLQLMVTVTHNLCLQPHQVILNKGPLLFLDTARLVYNNSPLHIRLEDPQLATVHILLNQVMLNNQQLPLLVMVIKLQRIHLTLLLELQQQLMVEVPQLLHSQVMFSLLQHKLDMISPTPSQLVMVPQPLLKCQHLLHMERVRHPRLVGTHSMTLVKCMVHLDEGSVSIFD